MVLESAEEHVVGGDDALRRWGRSRRSSRVVVPWTRSSHLPSVVFARRAILAALAAAAVESFDQTRRQPLRSADRRRRSLLGLSLVNEDLAVSSPRCPGMHGHRAARQRGGRMGRVMSLGRSRSRALSSARLIGTIVFVCAGSPGWLLLMAAFLCAAITSRMGLRRKTLLGIAEDRAGRRAAGNAIANTGIAAMAAALAAVSYAHASAPLPSRRH